MVLACLAVFLWQPLPLQNLRTALFDQYQRWQPRAYQDVPVRIIDIDEQSLQRLGQWPWPRTQVAALVERLQAAGASVIAFDVLFAEADRTSPEMMMRGEDLPPAIAQLLAALPSHDARLAAAVARSPVVLGFALERKPSPAGLPLSRFGLVEQGGPVLGHLPAFQGAIRPLPLLEQAAGGSGTLTFRPDSDGVVRRVPLLVGLGQAVRPSLIAEALRLQQRAGHYRAVSNAAGVERIDIGRLSIPTTAEGELWVHFSRAHAARTVPAWQVLAGQAPATLAGSIVLVGTSAQGLQDLRFSPLGGIIPGVEVHAQALEQILAGSYLQRPGWAIAVEALSLALGGLLVCLLALRLHALASASLTLGILVGLNALAWYAFTSQRLLFDLFTPTLLLALVFVAASLIRHRAAEREQRWIRQAFSRYVSPNLVKHLVDNPGQLTLGGHRQTCSFVFTDLTDFTEMVERKEPEAVVSLLNAYLDEVIAIAFRHEGTLDRIVGDAVAIMFSAPLAQPDHCARALSCALEIHHFARRYASELQARGIHFGQTRIGVHSGEVVVGNFGGSTIFDYRALGDPVNTTSRIEGLNAHVGTAVCVSEVIRRQCPQVPMRPVGEVLLKGKRQALRVFEPLQAAGIGGESDEAYEAAYGLLAGDDPGAGEAFDSLHAQRPDDGLVAFHAARLRAGERGDSFVMTRK
ncbi:CHASE2 domain-containing protein [Pseudomonas subflava]|uniref:CHASE2 domain-containing protein n=1 Tax=Pseudomonas subflava TaxID=2952933 RepID=UPI00207AEBB5